MKALATSLAILTLITSCGKKINNEICYYCNVYDVTGINITISFCDIENKPDDYKHPIYTSNGVFFVTKEWILSNCNIRY